MWNGTTNFIVISFFLGKNDKQLAYGRYDIISWTPLLATDSVTGQTLYICNGLNTSFYFWYRRERWRRETTPATTTTCGPLTTSTYSVNTYTAIANHTAGQDSTRTKYTLVKRFKDSYACVYYIYIVFVSWYALGMRNVYTHAYQINPTNT